MNAKSNKILYYVSTGLLTLLMGFSATMYFVNFEEVSQTFQGLGYPVFIIKPLAVAKILGLIAIWTKRSRQLMEWAYAGFFFDTLLALQAHIEVGDGMWQASAVGIVLVFVSYRTNRNLE